MEVQRSSPPPAPSFYVSHNPADLTLPSIPQTAISRPPVHAEITLPNLRTVLSPEFEELGQLPRLHNARTLTESPASARSLPRYEPEHTLRNGNGTISSVDSVVRSPSDAGSVMSTEDRVGRSTSVLSMDDPDVRIAAEALSGLGNPDFARSPRGGPTSATPSHGAVRVAQDEPEPLLELISKAHPWVGGTINGSLSAYSTTKNYSPRLVQIGANLVERNVTIPVVSTVSTVGRMTGIESGLRWYYGGNNTRRADDLDQESTDSASKRRRLDDADLESGTLSSTSEYRRESEESAWDSLPAYGASKPPSYREEASPNRNGGQLDRAITQQSWSSQVFVMTSGLGVALSETSRHSLRFCLGLLRNSAERVSTLMDALKLVLEQYDEARDAFHQTQGLDTEKGERPRTPEHDEAARRLAALLKRYSDEIWHTLQTVVKNVSEYAGGALPDNARQCVRNHLMSLPQRWRFVSDNQLGDSETSRSAHRMIAFATEGLDMMGQVSQTMKLTLETAERWLERAGRRRGLADSPQTAADKDVSMNEGDAVRRPLDEKK